jgi:hypothetical protein
MKITKTKSISEIKEVFAISNPPKDTISSLKFSDVDVENNYHHLLVTSWDKVINFDYF